MMRASIFRQRFPLLFLAAALVALGVFFAQDTPNTHADTSWQATFTVNDSSTGIVGCFSEAGCTSGLTDNSFTVGGTDFAINNISVSTGGRLTVGFDDNINSALSALSFCVGSSAYALSSTYLPAADTRNWQNTGLAWSLNDKIRVSIGTACHPGPVTGLFPRGTNQQVDLSWTAPTVTGGSAITGYDVHYTSAPKEGNGAVDDDADVTTGSDHAAGWVDASHSGTDASHEITGLTVRQDYRIRVRATNGAGAGPGDWVYGVGLPASDNADLASLTAGGSDSAGGTFTAFSLSPAFDAATISYTATVDHGVTHVKLTPTPAEPGRAETEGGQQGEILDIINPGQPTPAFALSVGDNAFTIRITAEDTVTIKFYTVTITRREQGATGPTVSLSAAPAVVEEGSSVTVTATLSEAQTGAVTIPVTVTSGSAESGDHGTLTGITIAGGDTAGTGTITTNQDTDTDDELFTVSLGTSLPSGITAGSHSSVGVTIADAAGTGFVAATVWTGTLTTGLVDSDPGRLGCVIVPDRGSNDQVADTKCVNRFAQMGGQPGNAFDHGGVDYEILKAFRTTGYHGQQTFSIAANRRLPENWVLVVDGSTWLSVRDANGHGRTPASHHEGRLSVPAHYNYFWSWTNVSWTAGGTSTLSYVVPRASVPTVALSASPSTVLEGGTVTVTATRSAAASSAVTLRLRGMLSSITIPSGQTSATATFTAAEDTDHTGITQWTEGQFDETLEVTVNAGTPPGVLTEPEASGFSGHGSSSKSLRIGVIDNDVTKPTIGLSCYNNHKRNWTNEGEEALVRLKISRIVRGETVIPLTYAHIDTEDGDFSGPASVTLTYPPSDAWTGVITIPEDGDTGEDEQLESFRVSLGTLPNWVTAAGSNCTHLIGDPTPDIGIIQNSPVIQADHSDLIARMYGWRNDPDWAHHKSHTDRWDRALLAFGETVEDTTLTPMTADEAQAFADRGMTRWVEVARALRQIEAGAQAQGQQQSPPNRAPAVSRALPDLTIVNESGSRTVSLSDVFSDAPDVFQDADGDSLTLTASSSDEAVATVSVASDTQGSSLTVQARARGAATITVTADDGNGGTAEESFAVTVKAKPAVVQRLADVSGLAVGASQEVSLAGVFRDADGDALSIEARSQDPDIAAVSAAADGSALTLSGAARGETGIMVTARDADGNRAGFQFQVTVASAASPEPADAGASPEPANVRVVPGDGILTVSWTVSSREGVADDEIKHALRWSQQSGVWANPTDPRAGGPEDGIAVAGGVYSYTITGLENGVATGVFVRSFTGSSHSERSERSSQWVRTKGEHTTPRDGAPPPATPNRAPTVSAAIGDATIVNQSGTKQVSLSGVFSDADNDALSVTAASSDEAVATVSVASDGSSLTATAQGRGTATITVTASDGNGGTVEDSFTVTVKAAPVVASAIADVSGLEAGSTQEVSLSGVFSDADGDSLTISATSGDDAKATVSAASDGSSLTLTGVAEGTATVTVNAQDSDGNRVSDAFEVSVVAPPPPATPNQAPTVSAAIADATIVNASGSQQVSLSGVFDDADGDALTVTAASDDEAKATVSVASDGSSLTVAAKSRGTATITVTASDGNGGSVEDSFTVTVKAAPVVASAIADVSGMTVGDSQDIDLTEVFSDADGDALTFSAETSDFEVVEAFLFLGTLTVAGLADGTAAITVTAQDSDGNTVSDAFDVKVVGPPSPVSGLSCVATTDRVLFSWDVPEWSGAQVYAYDYDLTRPDGGREQARLQGYPAVSARGDWQAGQQASISVKAVYELADGSEVYSAAATLSCTVAE